MRSLHLLFLALLPLGVSAAGYANFKHGDSTIRVPRPAIQSGAEELQWRLHSVSRPGPFDIRKETFELIIPRSYSHEKPHGLFLWISPGNRPSIPASWRPELAKRRLIFAGARNSGNRRNIFDRMRMAIDLNHHLRTSFNIDPDRVHLSGFSGGGRVASMLGVCYADMFPRTIPFMGVNYYRQIPAGKDRVFNPSYIPDEQILQIAKRQCRFVLVTGEKDFNRLNTLAMFEHGFRKDGFQFVRCVELPGIGHRLPGADRLAEILDLIDGR